MHGTYSVESVDGVFQIRGLSSVIQFWTFFISSFNIFKTVKINVRMIRVLCRILWLRNLLSDITTTSWTEIDRGCFAEEGRWAIRRRQITECMKVHKYGDAEKKTPLGGFHFTYLGKTQIYCILRHSKYAFFFFSFSTKCFLLYGFISLTFQIIFTFL